jgi:hypothetical protein
MATSQGEGDLVYSPRGSLARLTSTETLCWSGGWMGAGSIEDSCYEVHPESNK